MIDSTTEKDLDKLAELIKKHDLQEVIMRRGIVNNRRNNDSIEYEFILKAKNGEIPCSEEN